MNVIDICHELRAEDLAESFGAKLDLGWEKIPSISHHQDDATLARKRFILMFGSAEDQ